MKAIVAINNLGYIGNEGTMMWRCKEDFKHFKKLTTSADVNDLIVGRTTFEQCLGGRELPNRTMNVVGTGYKTLFEAVENAILGAIAIPRGMTAEVWVIGGKTIYDQLLPLCDEVHISHINNDDVGDVKFEMPANYRGKTYYYNFEEDK